MSVSGGSLCVLALVQGRMQDRVFHGLLAAVDADGQISVLNGDKKMVSAIPTASGEQLCCRRFVHALLCMHYGTRCVTVLVLGLPT